MCIIAAKPVGIEMPTDVQLYNMWNRNPDGAGFMYALNGKVYIEKGFMEFDRLKSRLEALAESYDLKGLGMVLHFRITTHGGTKPENCHPFPITDSMGMLKKLKLTTRVGVAHNGIIDVTPRSKDISDTMEFIAGELAPLHRAVPDFYKDKNLMQMVDHAVDGKMAFLTGDGKIYTVGKFEKNNGIMYSNSSYEHSFSWRDFDYMTCGAGTGTGYGGWENMGHISACTVEVMWLDETEGQYVVDDKNNPIYGEFAIDRTGHVYEYDYNEDLMYLSPELAAYTSEGLPLKFNKKSEMVTKEIAVY